MQSNTWRRLRAALAAAPFAALSIGLSSTPSTAAPPPTETEPATQCDIEDFRRTNIIDAEGSDKKPSKVRWGKVNKRRAVGATNILELDEPIPAGTVLVSGVTKDRSHRKDSLDGTSTLTETGERVAVRFVDKEGETVGETSPTPDLPDTATRAPFAQPSIELSAPAYGVQIVHAGDGTSPNKLRVRCLNIDPVSDDSPPSDLVRFLTCSNEDFAFAPNMRCGFMAVPEERSNPNSRLINVAFGVVPGEQPVGEPVVYLEGGPGGAPLTASGVLQELAFDEISGGRDVVYVDQRGTGFSQPSLTCVRLEDLVIEEPPFEEVTDPDSDDGSGDTEPVDESAVVPVSDPVDESATPESDESGNDDSDNDDEPAAPAIEDSVEESATPAIEDSGDEDDETVDEEIEESDESSEPLEEPPTEEEILELVRQEVQQCKNRLVDQNIDLSAYTTVENAADIDDLRQGLGVDTWNLFGGSYGTDLALSVMRDYPEGVNSAILDSVFQPEISAGKDNSISYQNNLDEIVARCLADADCGAAFPNLAADINAAAANVTQDPIPFGVENAEIVFGDGGLNINILSLMFIFEEANPSLPAWINGLASNDPAVRAATAENFAQTVLGLELEAAPTDARGRRSYEQRGLPSVAAFFSDGFYLSVTCAEEFPYRDNSAITRTSDTVWSPELLDAATIDFFPTCDIWDVAAEDPIVTEPVTSDIPSLVLASDTDFQTWPEWSRKAAETLPNSTLVEFEQVGHVVALNDGCPASIAAEFVENPTAVLDTSCVDELPAIDYAGSLAPAPSDDEIVELAEEAGVEDLV